MQQPAIKQEDIKTSSPKTPKKIRFKSAVTSLDQVRAERCKRSLYHFMHEFWPEVSTDKPLWNWHIEYLTKQLEGLAIRVSEKKPKEKDLIVNVPPGTTKSITCSIMFPTWCWTNWHWMRFIAGSYSGDLSLELGEYSRELIRSEKFKRLFPELEIKQDKDTKSNFRIQKKIYDKKGNYIKTEVGGNRYSTSVGGTLTGFHGHILIVDDPLDPKKAVSEVEIKKANRWMDQTLSTRKVDKAVTPTILIMQRLHENDPAGHLLDKKKKNIFHVCLPGEIRNYKDEVKPIELINNYQNDLLDPNRMDWDVLNEMEADLGQYGYAGQIGQKPTPPGGGMFKVDHFQIVDSIPSAVSIIKSVRYWDKAGTAGGGTYTVGVKMHKLKTGKYLISDVKRGQWSTDERENIIRETAEADGNKVTVYVEQEPGSGGKDSVQATIRNLAGYSVYADLPSGDKIFRADPCSVQVNNGNVLLLRSDWNRPFIEEHRFFPFSTYKDQVDATSGAFGKLAKNLIAGPLF